MSYLSRIRINPLRSASRKLLASPRAIHGAVMGGLPDHNPDDRILWRLDSDNPHRPELFVLTASHPDWTHVVESAGWPGAEGEHAAVRDYTPVLGQLAAGREFAFRLTANPVQNTRTPDKPSPQQAARPDRPRSFRIGHRTASAQLNWFLERTESWGFHVPAPPPFTDTTSTQPDPAELRDVRITSRDRRTFTKNGRGAPVTLHTATFEGRLRITDPAALRDRLLTGIGPAKAYGCGLLTLAPLTAKAA
ncbi:type I-E CRISPR-associated protein Cas6/Cse3/CasE [Streptantibioticus silvisoli]|jgi:CRISPR system Cascade subunit CasE|uniref:Type I-E CRISPR-associated protein Cas6/Cse3/CasE n=1 Tax=Streptantibioticus silvisoli TaxID=2705255 RepID=A0ABT6W2F0_9ACTN|nr:type I-E CRISPR-associated protein Cas6/Cse3/CasE [Streptantibioticus silvisoli]MDI5964921.1 type I-E CRISPR-associated protein Cas6/Cse3/CasE [Streptantibioticus silvisoli]